MWVTDVFRSLVYLRRIAHAQERQADALDQIARCVVSEWQHKYSKSRVGKIEVGLMDVAAVNERWEKQREADELGEVLLEEQ